MSCWLFIDQVLLRFPSPAELQCVVPTVYWVQPSAVLPALPPPLLPPAASPLRRQPDWLLGTSQHKYPSGRFTTHTHVTSHFLYMKSNTMWIVDVGETKWSHEPSSCCCCCVLRRRRSSRPWLCVWGSYPRPRSLPTPCTVPHVWSGRSAPLTWWHSGALRSQGSLRYRRSNHWYVCEMYKLSAVETMKFLKKQESMNGSEYILRVKIILRPSTFTLSAVLKCQVHILNLTSCEWFMWLNCYRHLEFSCSLDWQGPQSLLSEESDCTTNHVSHTLIVQHCFYLGRYLSFVENLECLACKFTLNP